MPDALRAFRQQRYSDRELVIINDGSPLVSHVSDVRVVNLPNRGARWTIGEKRNVGIRAARGERLATWDDDDLSLPNRLADQILVNADYVLADRMFIADDNLRLVGNCARTGRAVMPSALFSRSVAVCAGGYPVADYMEDAELLERVRYIARGRIAVIPADWYVMRRHDANVTVSFGECTDEYVACALRSPEVRRHQVQVDAVRAGPGGDDVTPWT